MEHNEINVGAKAEPSERILDNQKIDTEREEKNNNENNYNRNGGAIEFGAKASLAGAARIIVKTVHSVTPLMVKIRQTTGISGTSGQRRARKRSRGSSKIRIIRPKTMRKMRTTKPIRREKVLSIKTENLERRSRPCSPTAI
jgi:hypothetical protein